MNTNFNGTEIGQIFNQGLVYPLVFIFACITVFVIVGALIYYSSNSQKKFNGMPLALYFSDQGYKVQEVGVGGKDGGVGLVITDRRGEKTAVQAKCYAEHNKVGVPIVRELVGAKRNHDCVLSLLVTTSDLTPQARIEADQFKVDYWHGGLLEQKLKLWGKWQPGAKKKKVKSVVEPQPTVQHAASTASNCVCGASMVMRKGREGKSFLGCSTFPKCRHTRSVSS